MVVQVGSPQLSTVGILLNYDAATKGAAMTYKSILLSFALIFGYVAPAFADGFAIAGAGAFSCGKYLAERANNNAVGSNMLGSWIQGFLSGLNVAKTISEPEKKMVILPDFESILAYMDKYCRENPLSSVYLGSATLYGQLK
jgi:hypothetical protein